MRLILLATAALAAPLGAETRNIAVPAFTGVSNETAVDIAVRVGGDPSVRVEGDREVIDALQIGVERDELIVVARRGTRWPRGRAKAIVYVSVPRLAAAAVEGSGNIHVDRVTGPAFAGSAHGSGNLVVEDLRADAATLSSHGSGNVTASGTVTRLQAFASGSGNVDVGRLRAQTGSVRTTGSGNVDAVISDTAEVTVSGSGGAHVTGAKTCRVRSTGSGSISCG